MRNVLGKINIQVVFVLLYMLISLSLMVRAVGFWGISIHPGTGLYLYTGWCFFCFTSYWWFAPYDLAKMNVRQPTIGEEAPLQKLIDEVQTRACITINIDLRLEESDLYNAYATGRNIVVLSKGIVKDFTEQELCGVIAHEIGHLHDKDTMMITAYYMAGRLHWLLLFITRNVFNLRGFRRMFYWRERVMICVILVVIILFFASKFIMPAVLTSLYLFAIRCVDRFFKWSWLAISRYCEYQQDHFAWSLGYGGNLASALAKLAKAAPQEFSWFYITICGTHPVVYHRIRRLEILLQMTIMLQ